MTPDQEYLIRLTERQTNALEDIRRMLGILVNQVERGEDLTFDLEKENAR